MGFDHVNIVADDQEAVRDFLIAVVGVTQGPRPPFDFHGYWLYLDGRPIIHLKPRTAGIGGGWVDHIAFGPYDFEEQRQRLETARIAWRESEIPDTGIRQLFVTGPEGVLIELQCPS